MGHGRLLSLPLVPSAQRSHLHHAVATELSTTRLSGHDEQLSRAGRAIVGPPPAVVLWADLDLGKKHVGPPNLSLYIRHSYY